jgi:hypothetical protein
MDQRDLDAMRLAVAEVLRLEPTWGATVAGMLEAQPFAEVGAWAAGVCQVQNLKLRAWECPPCDTANVENPRDVYGSRPSEVALLRRMLTNRISRFHPDPLAAIERAA